MSAERNRSNGAPFWICVKKLPEEPKVRRTRLAGRLLELRGNRGERRLQIRGRRDRQALRQAPRGRAEDQGERQQPARQGFNICCSTIMSDSSRFSY